MEGSTVESPAETACQHLLTDFASLLDLLHLERQALTNPLPDSLEDTLTRKTRLCEDIARAQANFINASYAEHCSAAQMTALKEIASICDRENTINGRIAHRAKQTVTALVGILSGQGGEPLYGKNGDAGQAAAGLPGQHLGHA